MKYNIDLSKDTNQLPRTILRCPAEHNPNLLQSSNYFTPVSYGSVTFTQVNPPGSMGKRLNQVRNPSGCALLGDGFGYIFSAGTLSFIHGGEAVVLFFDGHAERLRVPEANSRSIPVNTLFNDD